MKCALIDPASQKIYHVQTGAIIGTVKNKTQQQERAEKEKNSFADIIFSLMLSNNLQMLENYSINEVVWENWQQYTKFDPMHLKPRYWQASGRTEILIGRLEYEALFPFSNSFLNRQYMMSQEVLDLSVDPDDDISEKQMASPIHKEEEESKGPLFKPFGIVPTETE